MTRVMNAIFSFLKLILLLASFAFTFFIIMNMYHRLDKNLAECVPTMIPFILLLLLFIVNIILGQKSVNKCLFYNITCCFTFAVILFAVYRSFFDQNMVMIEKLGYNINFNYFADVIAPMKIMLYILSIANICLMLSGISIKKEVSETVTTEEEKTVNSKLKKKDTKIKEEKKIEKNKKNEKSEKESND